MNVAQLLRLLSFPFYRRERLKSALTIAGVALGIAVYTAIRIANENSRVAFTSSAEALTGSKELRLTSDAGSVSELLIPKFYPHPLLEGIAPISVVHLPGRIGQTTIGLVQLVGSDPLQQRYVSDQRDAPVIDRKKVFDLLRKPNGIFVSEHFAKAVGGETLELLVNGHWTKMEILATLPNSGLAAAYGGFTAMMDISTFQDLTQSWGKIDSLALIPRDSHSPDEIRSTIAKLLPPGVRFQAPGEQAAHGQRMTEAFALNLNFLSCISLFVGALLIYNTTSFSMLKRRRDFSILLALGASLQRIRRFILLESLLLGLLASVLGLLGGYLLSRLAVGAISQTISAIYLPVRVQEVKIPLSLALEGLLLGPLMSLLASFFPLRELGSLGVRETLHYQTHEIDFKHQTKRLAAAGLLLLLLAGLFARTDVLQVSIYFGFISPTLLVFGAALLSPLALQSFTSLSRKILPKLLGVEVILAADHIQATLRRNSVAVAAMVMAIGMFLGVTIMIASFRDTVSDWISHITKADLYISPVQARRSSIGGYLPSEVTEKLRRNPLVKDFDWVTSKKIIFAGREMRLQGVRFNILNRYERLIFLQPMNPEELSSVLRDKKTVLVSESFASRTGLQIGDTINIPGTSHSFEGRIANIFYDYSSDQGTIFIRDDVFETLDGERRKQGLSLYLQDSSQASALQDEIRTAFPDVALDVRNNHQLRFEVLRVFDETFRITYALQAIALLVAGFTILNTILMLLLERQREFAVMRAIGASSTSLTKMVTMEAGLLGLAAVLGGIAVGGCLSFLLVAVINKFFFGWSMQFHLPMGVLLVGAFATIILSLLAGALPSRRIARSIDGSLLSYE